MRHGILTAVSLFAGVGGFDLAMQRSGINVVAAVEIDAPARAVLARRFPHTQLFSDVTKVSGNDLRNAGFVHNRGIITGGFPCQDLSVAGNRKGLAGERSGLFWHIIRLVDDLHPRWVVLENVPGLLSSQGGRDMGIVLGALGECGYGVAYRVLDAQHFGVPQRRRRVFIVAGRRAGAADSSGPVQILLEPEGSAGNPAKGRTEREEPAGTAENGFGGRRIVNALTRDGLGGGGPDDNLAQAGHLIPQPHSIAVATLVDSEPSLKSTLLSREVTGSDSRIWAGSASRENQAATLLNPGAAPRTTDIDGATFVVEQLEGLDCQPSELVTPTVRVCDGGSVSDAGQQVRRLTPLECERLQGFPDNWTEQQVDSARYKQMGNAVAVPVVEWIMRRLVAVDEETAS